MSVEDGFRRVLAARLPAGPGWTAWIDGTVQELAAAMPDEDSRLNEIRALCDEREQRAIDSPARTFYGDPFPARLSTQEVRAVLDTVPMGAS